MTDRAPTVKLSPPYFQSFVAEGLLSSQQSAHALMHYAQLCGIMLETRETPRARQLSLTGGAEPAQAFSSERLLETVAFLHGVTISEMTFHWSKVDAILKRHKLKAIPAKHKHLNRAIVLANH